MGFWGFDFSIAFDTEGIRDCAQKYREYSQELKDITEKLHETMDTLVTQDWRGKAADAFAKIVGDDWCVTVDRYCELVGELVRIFDIVTRTYDEIEIDAKALSIDGSGSGVGHSGAGGRC